jgi:hypothetical protein
LKDLNLLLIEKYLNRIQFLIILILLIIIIIVIIYILSINIFFNNIIIGFEFLIQNSIYFVIYNRYFNLLVIRGGDKYLFLNPINNSVFTLVFDNRSLE